MSPTKLGQAAARASTSTNLKARASTSISANLKGSSRYPRPLPSLTTTNQHVPATKLMIPPEHDAPMGSWTDDQIRQATSSNVMLTWMPGKAKESLPILRRGEGVYLYDSNDKQYLDWTSMAICSNLGYTVPQSIQEAVQKQLETLPYLYGGLALSEVRARFSHLMASILPCDLEGMVFPSSGAEANEAAIAIARRYTGKHKVINWYRSYHGGTNNSLQATGDFRRWYAGQGSAGFIKAFNPSPLFFELGGDTQEEKTQMALNMLEEQILYEGPDSIALIQVESIVGSGGVLLPPPGYMQGIRAICDKYNILLHCDEVMVGFGRTGALFGFQHELFGGIIPDIVTAAKGISSSLQPLSMTACRKHIMEHFETQSIGWGSTYQAHPVALACAYENVKYLIRNDVMGHVQQLGPVMEEQMERLAMKHPSIKQYRSVGLFGCFDTQLPNGESPQLLHEGMHDAFVQYKKAFSENGLIGLIRAPHLHVAPPLVITEEELVDGFERQDKALDALDSAMGFKMHASIALMKDF